MKKLLIFILLIFFLSKLSPYLMLFLMYGAMYLLSKYDPSLKVKMNDHQGQMIDMFETYFSNVLHAISLPTLLTYGFYIALVISVFFGFKMLIREVKTNGRTKEA